MSLTSDNLSNGSAPDRGVTNDAVVRHPDHAFERAKCTNAVAGLYDGDTPPRHRTRSLPAPQLLANARPAMGIEMLSTNLPSQASPSIGRASRLVASARPGTGLTMLINYLASMLRVSAVLANHGLYASFGNDSYHSRFLLRCYRDGIKNLGSRWRQDLAAVLNDE